MSESVVSASKRDSAPGKVSVSWAQFWAAFAAALIAIGAGAVSWWQADQSRQQNVVSEQQALVSFVSAIAGDPQTMEQESEAFKGNQSAQGNAQAGTSFVELTDSEEAAYLITLLGGHGVTAIEYYETAIGLEASESYTRSAALLTAAVNEATADSDPRTLANAWYAQATIAFRKGEYSSYSSDLTNAQNAFSAKLGATNAEYNGNLVYLKLFDASYKAGSGDCPTALSEMAGSQNLATRLGIKLTASDSGIINQIKMTCPPD
jgi:hypothetical protein